MDNRLLPWHSPHWHHLRQYQQQGRLPQALLISGKAGLGKRQLAQQFAAALLCRQPDDSGLACGLCRGCRLYLADTHPDFLTLSRLPDKASISVDQIRQLIDQANLKPQFDGHRIILIDPADALTDNAANAFLKYLEEPTERTLVLLITAMPGKLPATITSRCQKLALSVPRQELASAWLKLQRPELKVEEIDRTIHLAKGAPLQALDYASNGALAIHDSCFRAWLELAYRQSHPVLVAEQWQKWADLPILSWFADWLIDLQKCCHKANPNQLNNPSLHKSLAKLSGRPLAQEKVYILYNSVLESLRRQQSPINKQLMFEGLLIQWAQLNSN